MNLEQFKNVIKQNNCKTGPKHTLYALGPSGSGKSSSIIQAHNELGMNFFADVRLGVRDSSEIKGLLLPVISEARTIATLPDYFPEDKDAYGIILLDEIDHAPPSVQGAAYQLVLDRKIGSFELPPNVSVMMASNRKKDGGVHFNVPKPTKNRVIQLNVQTDVNEFINYSASVGIDPIITSFIKSHPEYLYHDGKGISGDGFNELGAFASPRSWHVVDDVIAFDTLEDFILEEMLVGTVGYGPTTAFIRFIEQANTTLNIDTILKGEISKIDLKDTKNISSMYYNLDIIKNYLNNNPKEMKKTQEGLLEFMNVIQDVTLKISWWKELNDVNPRIFKPTVKEKNSNDIRMNILKEIKDYLPK